MSEPQFTHNWISSNENGYSYPEDTERIPTDSIDDDGQDVLLSAYCYPPSSPLWPMSANPECLLLVKAVIWFSPPTFF
jgi:hypothetical protein